MCTSDMPMISYRYDNKLKCMNFEIAKLRKTYRKITHPYEIEDATDATQNLPIYLYFQ